MRTIICWVALAAVSCDGSRGSRPADALTDDGADAPVGPSIAVSFTGTAGGEIRVYSGATLLGACTQGCEVPVADGVEVQIVAWTPSKFAGLTGACVQPASENSEATSACSFTTPGDVEVAFDKAPGESWTRLSADEPAYHAVALDSQDRVIVASASGISKLSADGTQVRWMQPLASIGSIASGPNDTIYVLVGNELRKYDGNGSVLWSRTLATAWQPDRFVRGLGVGRDGAVAAHSGGSVVRWDTNGTQSWTRTANANVNAIDSQGVVYAVEGNDTSMPLRVRRWAATGTELAPIEQVSGGYTGHIALGSADQLFATSAGFSRARLNGPSFARFEDVDAPATIPLGVAPVSGNQIAWAFWLDEGTFHGIPVWELRSYSTTGVLGYRHVQQRLYDGLGYWAGVQANDIAASASGRIVVVGSYLRYDVPAMPQGFIQVYTP